MKTTTGEVRLRPGFRTATDRFSLNRLSDPALPSLLQLRLLNEKSVSTRAILETTSQESPEKQSPEEIFEESMEETELHASKRVRQIESSGDETDSTLGETDVDENLIPDFTSEDDRAHSTAATQEHEQASADEGTDEQLQVYRFDTFFLGIIT